MTEKFKFAHLVEGSVIQTSLRNEKRNADEGGALAPAQAQVHVPAHAQHTTVRTFDVRFHAMKSLTAPSRYDKLIRCEHVTQTALVREVVHLHTLGYKVEKVERDQFGTYWVRIVKARTYGLCAGRTGTDAVVTADGHRVISSTDREYLRTTREARE